MERKAASVTILTLLFIGTVTLTFNVQPVRASGTIYIRPDGSVDPPAASIQRDGDFYTFADDISDEIVVERSNIVIDGYGYTLRGSGSGYGFTLVRRNNVTIQNTNIKNFSCGIILHQSLYNTIWGNNITNTHEGIWLFWHSDYNIISENRIVANFIGVYSAPHSEHNIIAANNITNNLFQGIYTHESSFNLILQNNIAENNAEGIYIGLSSNNMIWGNNITNNYESAIRLMWYSNNNTVCANDLVANRNGILITHSSKYNNVSGNKMTANRARGIGLWESAAYNTISQNHITEGSTGVVLATFSNTFSQNKVANNKIFGVYLTLSSNNTLSENNITSNNEYGLWLFGYCDNNTIYGNNITSNVCGINVYLSSNNTIYHNNFVSNTNQAYDTNPSSNNWHHSTLLEGNYWSDYAGVDDGSGVGKHAICGDGIGDTMIPYPDEDYDFYPLVNPWTPKSSNSTEAIEELVETIENWDLPTGTKNSLTSKLYDFIHLLEKGNENGAIHKLMDFIDQVEGLRGKKLTDNQADYSIAEAQRIIDLINE